MSDPGCSCHINPPCSYCTSLKECEDCGVVSADVEETNCPYAEDVGNDPNVMITVCSKCHGERAADI